MIENFVMLVWIIGILFLISACIAINKNSKGIAGITFVAGVLLLSLASFVGGTGFYSHTTEEDIPANQLYLLNSDLIKSPDDKTILVLMTPVPIEAVQGDTAAIYVANVLKISPYYYRIPKDTISLGLVKGDIAIKKDGKLQKFEPTH